MKPEGKLVQKLDGLHGVIFVHVVVFMNSMSNFYMMKRVMRDNIQELFKRSFSLYSAHPMKGYSEHRYDNIRIKMTNDTKYIASTVQDDLAKTACVLMSVRYLYDDTNVHLDIYYTKDTDKTPTVKKITNILNFYVHVLNRIKHTTDINIILYLSTVPKLFPPTRDVVLSENNVNSGVTFLSEDHKQIIVYRKEELFKVLLHELIHYYRIDFHNYDVKYDDTFIKTYKIKVQYPPKNIANPLALYEAYTDTLACYGYMLTYSLFKKKPLHTIFEKETKHYMKQALRVYAFSKLRENTHCFSYYIAKAAVFHHFDLFIKMIEKHGIDVRDGGEVFLEFLRMCLTNKSFWQKLKSQGNSHIVLSSLRMTKINI